MSRNRTRRMIAFCLCAASLAGGCSWSDDSLIRDDGPAGTPRQPQAVERTPERNQQQVTPRQKVISAATAQIGRPYVYGGASPSGFDCSGLVHYAYSHAGVRTPRTTRGLWNEYDPLPTNHLEPGDILFFNIEGKPSHVGLYIGGGEFVHAPSSGRTVTTAELSNPYYRANFLRAARILRE